MPSKIVRALMGQNGRAEKIFRDKTWLDSPVERVYQTTKKEAVADIREQVFERCGGDSPAGGEIHECEECGRRITWDTMEMHEKIPKGKHGEVSLENCVALCHLCHTGSADSAHGNRRWQTAKLSPEGSND